MNKETSYEEQKTWNHLVRKKKVLLLENGVDPQVTASIMSSEFRWGSESRLSELLL